MRPGISPEQIRPLAAGERFQFRCHPEVPCFTDCCRQLDLRLTPYDALRLARRLGLSSAEFIDQYAIIEQEDDEFFPQVYLAMVDDGRASCPFVSPEGCGVYSDRPSACRTYPLGRGAILNANGSVKEMYVLLTEPHCRGFSESAIQDVQEWGNDQELVLYNTMNDLLLPLLHHPKFLHTDQQATPEQQSAFLLALYQLDLFREHLTEGILSPHLNLTAEEKGALTQDDEMLLRTALRWLQHVLIG